MANRRCCLPTHGNRVPVDRTMAGRGPGPCVLATRPDGYERCLSRESHATAPKNRTAFLPHPQARHRREIRIVDWSVHLPRRSGTRSGRRRTRAECRLAPKAVSGPSSALTKMTSAGSGRLPHPKTWSLPVTGFGHLHGLATLSKRIRPGRNRFGSPDSAAGRPSVNVRW